MCVYYATLTVIYGCFDDDGNGRLDPTEMLQVLESMNSQSAALFEGNYEKAKEAIMSADMYVTAVPNCHCFPSLPSLPLRVGLAATRKPGLDCSCCDLLQKWRWNGRLL